MLVFSSADVSLNQLFDALPDGVIWVQAVRDESSQLVDLQVNYCNAKAAEYAPDSQPLLPGTRLLGDGHVEAVHAAFVLAQYADVLDSGERREVQYFHEGIQRQVRVVRSKLGDGVLSVIHDETERYRAAAERTAQAILFDGVLNASLNGIITYSALRNEAGEIEDFKAETINKLAVNVLGLSDQTPGWQLLARFPGVAERGMFKRYVRVVETGESLRFETEYNADGVLGWFDVAVVKLGDGFVITFNDISESKRAALAVERQNNLLRGILDTSVNGTIVYEAIRKPESSGREITDFRFRLFNETARQDIRRRTGRDIAGSTLLTVYPNSHKTGAFDLYARVTETGRPERFEQHYPDLNVWYDMSLTKLDDGCVVTFVNITPNKQAQEILERSAAELQAVIDTAQTGIFLFSPVRNEADEITDFRFRTANRMLAAYVGQDPTTVQGALGSAWFPDYQTNGLFERYRQTYLTGETLRFDFHYDGSGIDVWLDIMATKLGDEVLVTFADFTPLKNAQLQVARQAGLLSSILDGSLNGIMAYQARRDERGEIRDFAVISANRAAESLLGTSADDLIGKTLLDLFPEERDLGLFARYVETVETGLACRTEARYEENGAEQWLAISASKLDDGFVVTFSDITEQKQAAARDLLYQQKLQRSNEELERFAYVASHDLQEPLRKINSFGDMLLKRHAATLPADAADKVGRMQAAAGRMQDLIRDLLTYSRVSSQQEAFKPVDLNALLRRVRSDLEVTIREKAARLRLDPMPFVPGDALQLQQLFQNLLSNALKFSKSGEAPVVEVRYRSLPGHEVPESTALPPEGQYHEISVSDNGIGFEATYAERIFEAFQRLHGRSEYAGTGVGLAIVKKVVENHRGGIAVSSEPGQGATFRVYLPTGEEIG